VQLLTSPARGGVGLILFEDFHWADPSTIEIVERIAGQIGNAPILLMITSRTTTLRSGSLMIRRILLQRLDDDDCRDIAGSVVRDKRLPSQLIQQIVARSDGVPLFVEELAAAALETGQVDPVASRPAEVDRLAIAKALETEHERVVERLLRVSTKTPLNTHSSSCACPD
jgi:predicted ATPase